MMDIRFRFFKTVTAFLPFFLFQTSAFSCPALNPPQQRLLDSLGIEVLSFSSRSSGKSDQSSRLKLAVSAQSARRLANAYLKLISVERAGLLLSQIFSEKRTLNSSEQAVFEQIRKRLPLTGAGPKPNRSDLPSDPIYDDVFSFPLCHYYEKIFQSVLVPQIFQHPLSTEEPFTLNPPPISPGSGALVYQVQDNCAKEIAFFKITEKKSSGLLEVLNTLTSERILSEKVQNPKIHSSLGWVKTLGVGEFPDHNYFIIQTAAPGHSLHSSLKSIFAGSLSSQDTPVTAVFNSVTQAFVSLHQRLNPKSRKTSSFEYLKFRNFVDYEIDVTRKKILGKEGILQTLLNQGRIRPEDEKTLHARISKTMKEYQKQIDKRRTKEIRGIRLGFTHGDAHGGNIFIDSAGKVTLIDYGNFFWSISTQDGFGVSDPANDVGRMGGYFQVEALMNGLSVPASAQLASQFLSTYLKNSRILKNSRADLNFRIAVDFYRSRYFSIQLLDQRGLKFHSQSSLLNEETLRDRLLQAWLRPLE